MKKLLLLLSIQALALGGFAQQKGFSFAEHKDKQQVDLLLNGKMITAYCYYDSAKKGFLWPINTVDGITVTRGYPFAPRAGERTDHPHHQGLWMNYEAVNGLDFWNHSTAIAFDKRDKYGTILNHKIVDKKTGPEGATLVTTADWVRPDGHVLLNESTTHRFTTKGNQLFIDRITTLKANDLDVVFKDVKDGFIALRVARELELPSQQADVFVDANGIKTAVPKINNEGVTGNYLTSEGVSGDASWSTRGRWTALHGKKDGKDIVIAIFDHPSNVGYPAYRHARGYGLFAINPLGQKVFSNGKEELNLTLKPGQSTTFHYRVLVSSGEPVNAAALNGIADAFAKEQ
ncbi:Methane oxygenase PmoA [Cnuella takakiae]|uniref:Methane oxygenase PmoA n=1 Tax=Cnuella takakiae TaxID=1302690 RepID=A0A1M5BTD2_9BACT|nr:PmoA family protein [Cnuella takakiae]OLY93501.1 hypothetical protein BUE76_17650 [Cnuella takakiae]SHF45527.1 Methane oxygenase PmoA [Cnuella takakiae]